VSIRGEPVEITSVADAVRRHRIGYVSEDRKNEGLVLMHSVLDNVGSPIWRRLANRFGLLGDGTVRAHTPEMIALADRIVVMNDYRVSGEIANTRQYDAMSEQIMALIQG